MKILWLALFLSILASCDPSGTPEKKGQPDRDSNPIREIRVRPGATLRENASIQSRSLSLLPFGTSVEILGPGEKSRIMGFEGPWLHIRTADGKHTGWIFGPLTGKPGTAEIFIYYGHLLITKNESERRFVTSLRGRTLPLELELSCLGEDLRPPEEAPWRSCRGEAKLEPDGSGKFSLGTTTDPHGSWNGIMGNRWEITDGRLVLLGDCTSYHNNYDSDYSCNEWTYKKPEGRLIIHGLKQVDGEWSNFVEGKLECGSKEIKYCDDEVFDPRRHTRKE